MRIVLPTFDICNGEGKVEGERVVRVGKVWGERGKRLLTRCCPFRVTLLGDSITARVATAAATTTTKAVAAAAVTYKEVMRDTGESLFMQSLAAGTAKTSV